MFTKSALIIGSAAALFFSSCKGKEKAEPAPADDFGFVKPADFPAPVYDFKDNKVTREGFELGRQLFYDPILSKNNTISCGTCHKQYGAFADPGHDVSHGIHDQQGTRNSPPIFNTAWWPTFFWDGGVVHIEQQPMGPITNPLEMDETLAGVVEKLKKHTQYPAMFRAAYGSDTITTQGIMRAMAQFMGMMVSNQSKYDKVKRGEATFTADEQAGYNLFKANCATCHTEPLFTDFSYSNNGLDTVFTDEGRKRITNNNGDLGKFKVPSLRNIERTFPYMHNGKFLTLNGVVDHYVNRIKQSPTLDSRLQTPIQLTPQQQQQLILFLHTLTDYTFINDKRFSEPVQ